MKQLNIAILLTALVAHGWAQASAEGVYKIARPMVVAIAAETPSGRVTGSGVIVQRDRVLTNCHVVRAATQTAVTYVSGRTTRATLLGQFGTLDLCLLESSTGGQLPAKIVPIAEISVGQTVYAIGNPLNLSATISSGIISSVRQDDGNTILQTTAPISPGSSGGGLFNDQGRLVGITTFTLRNGQNLNFAIPAQYVQVSQLGPVRAAMEALIPYRPLSFKGVPLGSTLAAFRTALPSASCAESSDPATVEMMGGVYATCDGETGFLGRSVTFRAQFLESEFFSVSIGVDPSGDLRSTARALANEISAQRGAFSSYSVETHDYQRSSGNILEWTVAEWKLQQTDSISVVVCTPARGMCTRDRVIVYLERQPAADRRGRKPEI